MIKADTSDLEKYLDNYINEFETKAEQAVRDFAHDTVVGLIRVSPYGDSIRFEDYYKNRLAPLPKEEGMLRANWKINLNKAGETVSYVAGSRKGENSLNNEYYTMLNYKLGDSFSFYNITPYLEHIHSQQAPEGVAAKATNALMLIYSKSNLNEYLK